jgi:hypothetical protein
MLLTRLNGHYDSLLVVDVVRSLKPPSELRKAPAEHCTMQSIHGIHDVLGRTCSENCHSFDSDANVYQKFECRVNFSAAEGGERSPGLRARGGSRLEVSCWCEEARALLGAQDLGP